jgi:hypothetical protein
MIASIALSPPSSIRATGTTDDRPPPLASGAAGSLAGIAAVGTAAGTAQQVGVAQRERLERATGAQSGATVLDDAFFRDQVANFLSGRREAQGDAVTSQRGDARAAENAALRDAQAQQQADAQEVVDAAVTLEQQAATEAANEATFTPPSAPAQDAAEVAGQVEAAAAANRAAADLIADRAVNSSVQADSSSSSLDASGDAQNASALTSRSDATRFSGALPGRADAANDADVAVTATPGSLLASVATQREQASNRSEGPQSALARAAQLFSEVDRIAQTSGLEENRGAASGRIRASA